MLIAMAPRDLLRFCVSATNTLALWQGHFTRWPVVLNYHLVGTDCPTAESSRFTHHERFLSGLISLQKSHRFISFDEFLCLRKNPNASKNCLLLTFDDGYSQSWDAAQEASNALQIPSDFFVNTNTLDNSSSNWNTQFNWLLAIKGVSSLDPLWKIINDGRRPHLSLCRTIVHERFNVKTVVPAIEESLDAMGYSPRSLSGHLGMFVSSSELLANACGVTIGNHTHHHYPLGRLSDEEVKSEIVDCHQILSDLLMKPPKNDKMISPRRPRRGRGGERGIGLLG